MPPLVRFLLFNLAVGFLAGLVVGCGFIQAGGIGDLLQGEPLGTALVLWSFSASFAMGAVGTGLLFIRND